METYYADNLYPIALSPGESYIAFHDLGPEDAHVIHILTPDKDVLEINGTFFQMSDPVWLPEPN